MDGGQESLVVALPLGEAEEGPEAVQLPCFQYLWRGSAEVELRAPRYLGYPTAQILRSSGLSEGQEQSKTALLNVRFPRRHLASSRQISARLPVPLEVAGPGEEGQRHVGLDARKGQRQDPEDGRLYTKLELEDKYATQYEAAEISLYWEQCCYHVPCACECYVVRLADADLGSDSRTKTIMPDIASDMLSAQASQLAESLRTRGWGVVDDFLRGAEADGLREMIRCWWAEGRLRVNAAGQGDQNVLARVLDDRDFLPRDLSVAHARTKNLVALLKNAGVPDLAKNPRCQAPIVTIYPGGGARYDRHFDSEKPSLLGFDRRVCTILLYLNPFWCQEDGGELRLYPETTKEDNLSIIFGQEPDCDEPCVTIEPIHGRLLIFFCEGCNAHEVLPSWRPRFAVTWEVHILD